MLGLWVAPNALKISLGIIGHIGSPLIEEITHFYHRLSSIQT